MKKLVTVLATITVILIIIAGAVQYFQAQRTPEPAPPEDTEEQAAPEEPGIDQPAWCPEYEFIAAPGTWESASDDDPLNPMANPHSFMLSVSGPVRDAYADDHVKVWTLPYTAQFKNINSQEEMSYDDSRQEGTSRLEAELTQMHSTCPGTQFILTGFSQGAVIVGDVADRIGGGEGPIPAASVAGVAMVADGRRETGVGINPGIDVNGIGAEIALQPINLLVQAVVPGASMRGPRPHGFGELADRTFQICAHNDTICDAPHDIGNGIDRALALLVANGIHARYASNTDVIPGQTTTDWLIGWARGLIDHHVRGS